MKLYNFNALPRYPGTSYTKFGYGILAPILLPGQNGFHKEGFFEPVGLQQFLAGADWLEFGAPLMSAVGDTWAPPQIYKSIEYGEAGSPHKGGVLAERYFIKSGKENLTPFRVKYRYASGGVDDLLYLENIQKFHSDTLGDGSFGPNFTDPVAMYSELAIDENLFHPYPIPKHVWEAFHHFHWNGGSPIAYAAFRDTDIVDHISRAIFSSEHRYGHAHADVPSPPSTDLLMRLHKAGAITANKLTRKYVKTDTVPLSSPEALSTETEQGDVLHTPEAFSRTAAALTQLRMTDLDVRYILLQGTLSEPEVSVALDRYGHLVPTLINQKTQCRLIAESAFDELKAYLSKNSDPYDLLECESLEIRIIKTHNDEALLIFKSSSQIKGNGLSVHIDLALLGLCAPGAAVTT